MAQTVERFDVGTLRLVSGEGRSIDVVVPLEGLSYAGQRYSAGERVDARLDVSHTTSGHALRLRFGKSVV